MGIFSMFRNPLRKKGATIDYCEFIVTEKCFFACKMCEMWKNTKDETMTLKDWKRMADEITLLAKPGLKIGVCGGETLLFPKLEELISYLRKKGFGVFITTNAFLLDRRKMLSLYDAGLREIVISLDSHERSIHDMIRGKDGSYDKVMDSLNLLKYYPSLHTTLLATISSLNVDGLVGLAEFSKKLSHPISFNAITEPLCSDAGDDWQDKPEYAYLWPEQNKVNSAIDRLIELKSQGHGISNPVAQLRSFKDYFSDPKEFLKKDHCHMGRSISINPQGHVFMCHRFGSIGNINASSFSDLWTGQKAGSIREAILGCSTNCKMLVNCNYEDSAGGSACSKN